MRRALRVHPDGARGPVTRIEVEIARAGPATLELVYELTGRTEDLRIPSPALQDRTDGLWRHTCFEAFLRPGSGEAYLEFNFSPSGQWAAYRFSGRRAGMAPVEELPTPRIAFARAADALTLKVRLDLSGVPELAGAAAWSLGLAAVIETGPGAISYWALAHPPGKPDFHHPDGFACRVPAPEDA